MITVPEPLCLLTVHAHPDDESSKGPATVAFYHSRGVHTVLVCCTGGEEGDILNPTMDKPEVRADIAGCRRAELADAAKIIGYDEVVMLGYRDSGMPGTEANSHPDCFARAQEDEAVGRLVAVVRRTRPQVIIAYGDEQSGYPHPDHLRVHDIAVRAFTAAADAGAFPDAGAPWQPAKLYYTTFSSKRFRTVHQKFLDLGLESPFDEKWQERWKNRPDQPVTASIDVTEFTSVRREALLAHRTQVDPTSKSWFGLPPEVMDEIEPHDDYQLGRTAPGVTWPEGIEDDLFAGIPSGKA